MARQLVVHVVGARPNYMKVAPVYAALEHRGNVEQRLVHTGQHYDALLKDVFFAELPLPRPHVQLEARTPESAVDELERTFADLQPDVVVVAGDVNSTLAGTVAARKRGVRVVHIESGLRSHDWSMPEEINRVITDHLAALLLTTLPSANEHLSHGAVVLDSALLVFREGLETILVLAAVTASMVTEPSVPRSELCPLRSFTGKTRRSLSHYWSAESRHTLPKLSIARPRFLSDGVFAQRE